LSANSPKPLVELHVFYVPEEVWNFKLNTVSADLTSKFISAGFIRVPRHVTLRALREQLGDFLGEDAFADKFIFLKHIGKKLAVVKAKQETELKLKLFAPPHALHPELYLLPGVDHFEIAYSSSTTPNTQHFNAESHRSPHGPSTLNLAKKEPEKSLTFLESPQKNTLRQNQEDSRVTPNPKGPVSYLGQVGTPVLTKDNTEASFSSKLIKAMATLTSSQRHRCTNTTVLLKMVEQLKQTKAERRHMERTREELVKKAKGLLEQNKLRRSHVRDAWKKKYFETKKATASLEDILNKLRQDLELYYQKLLLQLEARDIRKRPNNLTHIANTKNTTIIQITTVQHEIDQLKRKLDNTKMKLIIEIKSRNKTKLVQCSYPFPFENARIAQKPSYNKGLEVRTNGSSVMCRWHSSHVQRGSCS
uniref:Spermatogenesis-associated protein 1 C-terminal domain-containing protein n=1 Tax=Chelydra serpentina TaxID=8475 RepID=A0A8C3STE7_CHESE